MKLKTSVLLYRSQGTWTLSTHTGDIIPTTELPTAKVARTHARKHGWRVVRAFNCDEPATP